MVAMIAICSSVIVLALQYNIRDTRVLSKGEGGVNNQSLGAPSASIERMTCSISSNMQHPALGCQAFIWKMHQ